MTIAEQVQEKLKTLSEAQQRDVLAYVEGLEAGMNAPKPARENTVKGLWADLDIDITEEEFKALRREMWSISDPDDAVEAVAAEEEQTEA